VNAAEFIKTQGQAKPLHPIKVRIVDPENSSVLAEMPAVLRFVPDRLALAALDAANKELAGLGAPPTAERRAAEEAFHLVALALRQEADPSQPLFNSALQAKSMLVRDEAVRVRDEYQRYVDTYFPPAFSDEEARRLAADAKAFFFSDLLTRYGYWRILQALPFLALAYGASLTPTSSPTESAST